MAILLSACASSAPQMSDGPPGAGQAVSPRSVSTALQRAAISAELGRLASELDTYYRRERVFTSDIREVGFSPQDEVSIRLAATASRWSAEAFHTRLGVGEKCVMWNGATDHDQISTRLLPGFNVPRKFLQCTWDLGDFRQSYELHLRVEATATQSARNTMAADLRRLFQFQEDLKANSGTVTAEPLAAGFVFSSGVSARLTLWGDSDWSAVVEHEKVEPLYQCAIWDGHYPDAGRNLLPGGGNLPTPRTIRCTWEESRQPLEHGGDPPNG